MKALFLGLMLITFGITTNLIAEEGAAPPAGAPATEQAAPPAAADSKMDEKPMKAKKAKKSKKAKKAKKSKKTDDAAPAGR